MSRRGAGLKLALLAVPLAAGVASLHAFGEPAGRAVRSTLMTWEYPARVHGRFHVRDRRGSDYHASVARTLEEFTVEMTRSWAGPPDLLTPARVNVLLVDTVEDLEAFGFEAGRIDQGGVADPPTSTIALVGQGATRDQTKDTRALRHLMTHLLFPRVPAPWLAEGLACHFETPAKGAARTFRADPPAIASLLRAPESDFRSLSSAGALEGAQLFVEFLLERERGTISALLRGDAAPLLNDLPPLEEEWRAWLSRTK